MTSDRGMCGAVHSGICKQIRNSMGDRPSGGAEVKLVAIGEKARALLARWESVWQNAVHKKTIICEKGNALTLSQQMWVAHCWSVKIVLMFCDFTFQKCWQKNCDADSAFTFAGNNTKNMCLNLSE